MSVSIFYTAMRDQSLTRKEQSAVDAAIERFAIEGQIERRRHPGEGPNWESFCVYDPKNPTQEKVIFEGATKLPDNSENAIWEGLQHWCQLLSIIRRLLPGAHWRVHVDDHDIVWDDVAGQYDPTQ
jgi:hypothetical protein